MGRTVGRGVPPAHLKQESQVTSGCVQLADTRSCSKGLLILPHPWCRSLCSIGPLLLAAQAADSIFVHHSSQFFLLLLDPNLPHSNIHPSALAGPSPAVRTCFLLSLRLTP